MSRAHVRHAGARSAYRATRRADTDGAWRRSAPRRAAAPDRQRAYEPSTAPAAAYRAAYTESPRRQPVRSERAYYRTQRPVRPSYGGSGQSYHTRRHAGQTRSYATIAPDVRRRDCTPVRYRAPQAAAMAAAYPRQRRHDAAPRIQTPYARASYRAGRPCRTAPHTGAPRLRDSTPAARYTSYALTGKPYRTSSPYHLHAGYGHAAAARRANPRLPAAMPRHGRGVARVTGTGRTVRTGTTGVRTAFHGTRYAPAVHLAQAAAAQPDGIRIRRGSGLRDRLGHATTMMVANIAQSGADRTDIADSMGHTAVELAARAGMTATGVTIRAVGRTAGKARAVMNRDKQAVLATYKAGEKASRQLDKKLRKSAPDAARAKRVADAKKRAGKPTVLSDAKPSARIGRFAAKGKASRMIGKRVGGGLRKAGRGVKRLGSTGLGWADEASARITAADDDPTSRLAGTARDLTFKATRKGVKGVTSSARFIWRHRRAPAKAAHGAKAAGRTGARMARAVVQAVRAAASRIVAGVASVSLPVIPIIAAMLAVLGVLMAVMAAFLGSSASADTGVANVPAEYEADVLRAGSICQVVTPSVIAAQIDQESGWNPKAGSGAGAQGIAQFMPDTWASAGKDGDGDGKADIWNPHDAIWSQGNYMCGLASQVESAKKAGRLTGDTLQLTLAAYNAGIGAVMKYGTIPPYAETTNYVRRIVELSRSKYAASGGDNGDSGPTAGTLKPKLVMRDGYHVDIEKMGLHYTRFPDYDTYQCTWWAAMRRNQIGKPVDAHMGNGAQWNDTAARLGYKVGRKPKPGDVMCFEAGVHGADGYYGHVAVVEQVNSDGSILISQSGTGWMAVVTETISASELAAMGNGISFIH